MMFAGVEGVVAGHGSNTLSSGTASGPSSHLNRALSPATGTLNQRIYYSGGSCTVNHASGIVNGHYSAVP